MTSGLSSERRADFGREPGARSMSMEAVPERHRRKCELVGMGRKAPFPNGR